MTTYALRHYISLDDNILLQSSQTEIRTEEALQNSYSSIHFIWSLFNIMQLFSLFFMALFISGFVSFFSRLTFKNLFKISLFALIIFVFENLAYTFYYVIFPPDIIKDMNVNVSSLQNLFDGEFLRYVSGKFTLFNVWYLWIVAELIHGVAEKKAHELKVYVLVFSGFIVKVLLNYVLF
jgi:hypothetical protein